jgi:hypothetical protein
MALFKKHGAEFDEVIHLQGKSGGGRVQPSPAASRGKNRRSFARVMNLTFTVPYYW